MGDAGQMCIQKGKGRKLKKKRKGLKIAVITIICLVVIALAVTGGYLYQKVNSGLFFEGTTINGYDVSEQTCKAVLLEMVQDYSAPKLTITEKGEPALTLSLEDMGYTIDQMALLDSLKDCMRQQNLSLLFSLMDGNSFEVGIPFTYDENKFRSAVTAKAFSAPRVASTDASMQYDGVSYYIEPETYGNELDDADLQVLVKDYVDHLTSESRPQSDASIDVPESFYYLPAVTQTDSEMNTLMNIYNSYCKAYITLTFGEKTEIIDWTTVQTWLNIEDGVGTINEEAVYDYAYELAAKYDTLYYNRDFTTHDGSTIHYESSDYGYQIDKDGEAAQLLADINSNTAVTREPVYSVKGYRRNGRDDVCGNYVEVNLSAQHLWFYMDGELIVETDVVSGLPTPERETATGVFTIPYKKSPETLKGDTWSEDVTYWMPFHDGQGLHDAPWRGSFGGNIYQSNGSHGCVNLPADAARIIYEHMEERVPIFLYK